MSVFHACTCIYLERRLLPFLQHAEWNGCTHTQMGMMDAIMTLDQLVDESDPDVDFPNSFHAFQTAEGIRQAHPDKGNHGDRLNCKIHRFDNKINLVL